MTKQARIEQLLQCFAENRRLMARQIQIDNSVTKAQYEIMWQIHAGIHRVVDVAAQMQTSTSAVTQLVQQLVEGGYVERQSSSTDRREVVLSLTKSGQECLDKMHTSLRKWAAGIANALSEQELDQYIAINNKIADYLKQKEL